MFFDMWYQGHMTLMVSSIAPLHLLVQDNENEMQHDFFIHFTLLALAQVAHYSDGSVNGTLYLSGPDNWNNVLHNIFCVDFSFCCSIK